MAAQYVYTPYGVEEPYNNSGNPYRYTGRRLEAEWGIFNYRARYYDPALGRFYQTDPILYQDQFNLYAYVGNDPLNRTDPSGMCENDPLCEGEFSDPYQDANEEQGGVALQDAFNFGDGSLYVADPVAFQMDRAIDIGTTIQDAISAGNSISAAAYAEALENGSAEIGPAEVSFNLGASYLEPGNPSARSIGRFQAILTGTMTVDSEDGSYIVEGSLSFFDNEYSWDPDSSGLNNLVIRAVGQTTRYRGELTGPHGIARNNGTPVPLDFSRSYRFRAWGEGR